MSSRFARLDRGRFGPWALVTGSSSGIGKELARQVAASGIHVVMVARRQHLMDDLGRQLVTDFGVQYRTVGVDLTREDFLDPIRAATDDLDIGLLISNAGAPLLAEFVDTPVDALLRQIRLDVSAPLQLIRHFAPRLARRGRGGVILVSAMGAAQGLPLAATAAAGKSFLLSLGYGLHDEFTRLGLNTTVLIPGPTDTAVLEMMGMDPARMPIKPIPASVSAAEALAALVANRPSHISGRITRLVYRLMPTSLSTRMARRMLANAFAARTGPAVPGVMEGGAGVNTTRITRVDATRFGPWAIVTGSSSGIGKQFARQLASSGLNLVLVARRLEALDSHGRDLANEFGIEYRAIGLDLSNEGFLEMLERATVDLDVGLVISNAGASLGFFKDMLEHDREGLHRMLRLNTFAHLDLAHHFGQRLAERGRGGLLLVSSLGARQGWPGAADYAASKAFVMILGESLNVELSKHGVTVTVLLPGATETEMVQSYGVDAPTMNRMMRPTRLMSVEQVVAEGLAALGARRPTHIPGRANRTMARLLPRGAFTRMLGSMSAQLRAATQVA